MFAAALPAVSLSALGAAALGLLALPWLIRLPAVALTFLFISLVAGQTARLPLPGQGGGLLLSDAATVAVLAAALVQTFSRARIASPLLFVVLPYLAWSAFSLALNTASLTLPELAIAAAYWLRLAAHLLLLPALLILFRDEMLRIFARRGLIIVVAALVLLGFAQLWFIPNLTFLTPQGWDPHQGRLVSTWLDPNFFGAFLALTLPTLVQVGVVSRGRRQVNGVLAIALASMGALLLTQSRSAVVALGAAALCLSPVMLITLLRRPAPPRLAAGISFLFLLLLAGTVSAVILQHRLAGLVVPDATVTLRLSSLPAVWHLTEEHPWAGVGAGAYQFAARDSGLNEDFSIHSRAGSDNSLLTVWATTGIVGLALFLLPWAYSVHLLWGRRTAAMPALAAVIILLVHSQFINSFLYAHLLITLSLLVTLALSEKEAA